LKLALRLEPEAVEELEAAASWYEAKQKGLGVEFVAAVDDALSIAREAPLAFATALGADDVHRVPVERFPYVAVYLVTAETLHVIAIAHARRRPLYWLGRARRSRG
jgi:toxin ParE1/3/4